MNRNGSVGRSIGAVAAGFLAVVALSLGVDHVFHLLRVYPPYGEPMLDNALLALALAYRLPINAFGSWITARLAPANPWKHVWIGASIGFVLTVIGAIVGIKMKMSGTWYPITLALSTWPTAWLGGTLALRGRADA